MKKKALYTTPEEVRALLRSCWPEETFALDNDVIASGGQADVYRLHSKNGLEALKIINSGIYSDQNIRLDRKRRAEQEVFYTTKHSGKPFSVLVYGTGTMQNGPDESFSLRAIRMELLTPLETYLDSFRHDRAQYIRQVLFLMEQAADALEQLRQCATLHKDIKENNLMVRQCGSEPKLVLSDYGLARPDRNMNSADIISASGTDQYTAPELLYGRKIIENRSDVFALGVAFFHLVYGGNVRFDPVAYAVDWKKYNISSGISKVILKMTQRAPAKRCSSAQAVAELHRLRLKADPELHRREIRSTLQAITTNATQTPSLLARLPDDSAACLLRASAALHKGNTALARQELTHGTNQHSAAAAYYLAGLTTSPHTQHRLLQFAAAQGFKPAQATLRHCPISRDCCLNALKAALDL